ncbi:hypothetical protein PsYK624_098930 [Phanerochaete sordida]|uniref:Fungal-type protein kinase domain-containing protein n=1 Tax=Phanerochaete sordida TaxID=48140 RepID=A0A9P3LH45_9APHY|nr:hypothetical protein PsYK624_098930 [Phanerochaete sordida]
MDSMYVTIPFAQFRRTFVSRQRVPDDLKERIRLPATLRAVIAKITAKTGDKEPGTARLEDPMYPVLIDSMNSIMEIVGYEARFKIVANHPEDKTWDSKPDIVLYPTEKADPDAHKAYTSKLAKKFREKQPDHARCAWAFMRTVMEVKVNENRAGFWFTQHHESEAEKRTREEGAGSEKMDVDAEGADGERRRSEDPEADILDGPQEATEEHDDAEDAAGSETEEYDDSLDEEPVSAKSILNTSEVGNRARSQHAKYASQIMLRQHRTHVITFCLAGEEVRAFRWDRAGCVMTESVNLFENPWDFFDLLYALAKQAKENEMIWGFDDTVSRASTEDINKLKAYRATNPFQEASRKVIVESQLFYPIYKVACRSVSVGETPASEGDVELLIGRAVAGHGMPVGRCTRGYIAYRMSGDDSTSRMCFLKDQWRAKLRRPELDAYRVLHEHNTPRIPTPIAGGDVGCRRTPQQTKTQIYLVPKAKQQAYTRVHTRLVTKEVCQQLETYKTSPQLIGVLLGALKAHSVAWTDAGILHRDISVGNVMINSEDGQGMLIDWDLCKFKADFNKPACEPGGMSGTWPFMSSLSLIYPEKPPEVADDLESFVQLALWLAFRFHKHDLSPSELPSKAATEDIRRVNKDNGKLLQYINAYFYEEVVKNGRYTGGKLKEMAITGTRLPINLEKQDGFFATFIKRAFALLKEHYLAVDRAKLEKYLPRANSPSDPPSAGRGTPLSDRVDPVAAAPTDFAAPAGLADLFRDRPRTAAAPVATAAAGEETRQIRNLPARAAKKQAIANNAPRTTKQPRAPARPPPAHTRVLDTHDALIDVFRDMLYDHRTGEPLSLLDMYGGDDYLFDQFNNLGDSMKNETGEKLSAQQRLVANAGSSAAKRRSDAGESDTPGDSISQAGSKKARTGARLAGDDDGDRGEDPGDDAPEAGPSRLPPMPRTPCSVRIYHDDDVIFSPSRSAGRPSPSRSSLVMLSPGKPKTPRTPRSIRFSAD